MDLMEAISARHSYRGDFLQTPVPREDLAAIMQAGIDAPSGCNKQTTSFLAVDDPELLKRILAVIRPPVARTAPAAICVLTRRIAAYRDRCFAVQDYAAAIENMLLAITALGYQSCWYEGYLTDEDRSGDQIAAILGVPEEYDLVALLPVGIGAEPASGPAKQPFEKRAWFNSYGGVRKSRYTEADYDAVCTFFAELNRGNTLHMNWNWARWEWMYLHDEMDRTLLNHIGLWQQGDRVVGLTAYDMYLGEGCALWLTEYRELAAEIRDDAWAHLRDESGLGIAVNDRDFESQKALQKHGFSREEQTETLLKCDLAGLQEPAIPEGLRLRELDPRADGAAMQWLMWQGFDHGSDRAACEAETQPMQPRAHQRSETMLALTDEDGRDVAFCGCWYLDGTDYAYVEPLCVIPEYRGRGLGRALLLQNLIRCRNLGAKTAYVLSDLPFYRKAGFADCETYTFWRRA